MKLSFFPICKQGSERVNDSKLGRQTDQGIKLLPPESHFSFTHWMNYILPALHEVIHGDPQLRKHEKCFLTSYIWCNHPLCTQRTTHTQRRIQGIEIHITSTSYKKSSSFTGVRAMVCVMLVNGLTFAQNSHLSGITCDPGSLTGSLECDVC